VKSALLGEAVDVRRLVAHHAHVVGADVELADVVSPDYEDVGLLVRRQHRCGQTHRRKDQCQQERFTLAHGVFLLPTRM
jgi:hypothetical protein